MQRFTWDSLPILLPKGSTQKEGAHSSSPAEQLFPKGTCCDVFFKLSLRLITRTFSLQETESNCKSSASLKIQLRAFIYLVSQLQHNLPLNYKWT